MAGESNTNHFSNQVMIGEGDDSSVAGGGAVVEDSSGAQLGAGSVADTNRKLFVGSLGPETKRRDLQLYFSKFGPIDSVYVIYDVQTRISKGYGFVKFSDVSAMNRVLSIGKHFVNGKKVHVKLAKIRSGKMYVSGITTEMDVNFLFAHFLQYGNVISVKIITDGRPPFGFVTFDDDEVANDLIKSRKETINGVEVYFFPAKKQKNHRGPINVAVAGPSVRAGATGGLR